MDLGRQKDLHKLQSVIEDRNQPFVTRSIASRSKRSILRDATDRKLTNMRVRLIRAAQSLDQREEWKIANQIRDYLKKVKLDEDTGNY